MRKLAAILVLTLGMGQIIFAQTVTDLFQPKTSFSRSFAEIASSSQPLTLNKNRFSVIQKEAPATLTLEFPFENSNLKLDLVKTVITSPNFRVTEKQSNGTEKIVAYNDALFYRGKVHGNETSTATVSIVGGQVMGIISDDRGNIVLGAISEKGFATDEYTLYRESALKIKNPSSCFTSDEMIGSIPDASSSKENQTGEPIDIYFECDYRVYTNRGSNVNNVVNFVLGFFNNTVAIYEREDIKVQVSQITVWTTQDPEAAGGLNTADTVLKSFSNRMLGSDYIGDYAHYLSGRALGGGIAYLLGNPCSSSITRQYRTAVSAIDNIYLAYPTYSWTVFVVSHELGHNFGSHHTQWCGWTGGALDNCFETEPVTDGSAACVPGPPPVNGGTIMSYCHLTSYGVNFNNGFGVQPGNRVRQVIGAATCLGACRMTITVDKFDASCNQNNGSATVVTTANSGALTYTWSNGQTGASLLNVAPGTYFVTVKDAAGCQVMEDVVIGNAGTSLTFEVSPGNTAGFCAGGNVVLSATSNPGYTYVWSRNGTTIPGASSSTYTATQAGNYSIAITSGTCNGTKSIVVSQVATPTASITPSGPTTFCANDSVILDAGIGSSYTYQWSRNGTVLAGETNDTYIATTSGNYTVRVSAGSTCQANSTATIVTVNPLPLVSLAAAGATSFCMGKNVVLSTTEDASYTYTWTRNGTPIPGANTATYTANTAGTYRVIVTDGSCTVTSQAITVTVFATPDVTVTPVNVTIEKFNTVTLTVSGAPFYDLAAQPYLVTYTSNSVTVRPPATTIYSIRGYDSNGCEDIATATITVIGCGQVTDIDTINLSPSRVLVTWTNPEGVTTDTLQYRKVGESTWTKILVTGDSYEVNGLEPGSNYEFTVTSLCTSTAIFLPSALQSINTTVLNSGVFLRLFPNPAVGDSRLEIISNEPYTLSVTLYDLSGKLVSQPVSHGTFPAGQTLRTIETSTLAAGIYHLAVRLNGKLESLKLMVAH
ncbi:MAG: M12 family metallo-peptidase [Chitinophagaceae bacterium]